MANYLEELSCQNGSGIDQNGISNLKLKVLLATNNINITRVDHMRNSLEVVRYHKIDQEGKLILADSPIDY